MLNEDFLIWVDFAVDVDLLGIVLLFLELLGGVDFEVRVGTQRVWKEYTFADASEKLICFFGGEELIVDVVIVLYIDIFESIL